MQKILQGPQEDKAKERESSKQKQDQRQARLLKGVLLKKTGVALCYDSEAKCGLVKPRLRGLSGLSVLGNHVPHLLNRPYHLG